MEKGKHDDESGRYLKFFVWIFNTVLMEANCVSDSGKHGES